MSDDNLDLDTLNSYDAWYELEFNDEKFLVMEGKDFVDIIPKENAMVSFNSNNCFRIPYKEVLGYYLSDDFREIERYDFQSIDEMVNTAIFDEEQYYWNCSWGSTEIPFDIEEEQTLVEIYALVGLRYMNPLASQKWDSYKRHNREYAKTHGADWFTNNKKEESK